MPDIDIYIYVLVALLPLSSLALIFQVNPYHALVVRGVLGAISALVYGVLGAADVALTEALMGTVLAITLYAVAVRSSMVMRLGVLEGEKSADLQDILAKLRSIIAKWYLRLELVSYENPHALKEALLNQEVHGICQPESPQLYHTAVRVRRLYDIIKGENYPANLTYLESEEQQ
jgi:putative multicomponent Na+:H+ antiporter subunit B